MFWRFAFSSAKYVNPRSQTCHHSLNSNLNPCVVLENIHTPPSYGSFFSLNPQPLWKFQSSAIPSFAKFCFWTPFPLWIFINLPWAGYGYFLKLHNIYQLDTCQCHSTRRDYSHNPHSPLSCLYNRQVLRWIPHKKTHHHLPSIVRKIILRITNRVASIWGKNTLLSTKNYLFQEAKKYMYVCNKYMQNWLHDTR